MGARAVRVVGLVAAGTALAGAAAPASAQQQPLGAPTYVHTVDSYTSVPPPPPADPPRRILYLNREGGAYTYANVNNSAKNESSIAWCNNGASPCVVDKWIVPEETWQGVMSCSRLLWGRYNVEITDVDPGDVDHIEAVVAGEPEDVGLSTGTGGVAPVSCSVPVLERSIVYIFSKRLGPTNAQRVCEIIGQEVGHSMGLDHELQCDDPMTYLAGCTPKVFQDAYAKCHDMQLMEYPCMCTGAATQNSHKHLTERLGPAETEAPVVTISAPGDSGNVSPGFALTAAATDNYNVTKIDLHVDGTFVLGYSGDATSMVVPKTVPVGTHTFELRAYDPAGNIGTAEVSLTISAECAGSGQADCAAGFECVSGVCFTGFGGACSDSSECATGACAVTQAGESICSSRCGGAGNDACPSGFTCAGTAGSPVMYCEAGGGGGGCGVGSGATGSAGTGLLGALAILLACRRRR